MLVWSQAVALIALALSGAPIPGKKSEQVSPLAFRKLVEATRGALVRVPSAPATGVLIGAHGAVLVPDHVVGKSGGVDVELKGALMRGALVDRDAKLGLALIALPQGDYPAASAGSATRLANGSFLLGMAFDLSGKVLPAAGRFTGLRQVAGSARINAQLKSLPGCILFNARGEMVGLHVVKRQGFVPMDDVRARFAGGAPP